jgi:hypothetical protein
MSRVIPRGKDRNTTFASRHFRLVAFPLFDTLSTMSLKRMFLILLLLGAALPTTFAQDLGRRPELEESLTSRYRVTVLGGGFMGVRGSENAIRKAGGVVVLVRDGLYGSYDRSGQISNAVQNGKAEILSGDKAKSVALVRGERFYVTAIHVGDDVVTMGLVSVRMIPSSARTSQVWCSVNFFLPKDTLAQGDIGKISPAIDQWLLPEGAISGLPPALTPAAVPSNPVDLKPGMTRDEIVSALGTPVQEAGYGDHRWLTYPGMTITLEQGKLTTVERNAQTLVPVNVSSDPVGADVLLDGNFVSSTPAVLRLQPGTYKVTVKMSGYADWQREIKILPGAEVNLNAKLSK